MSEGAVAAVDLGASSGRVIVGRVADGRCRSRRSTASPTSRSSSRTGCTGTPCACTTRSSTGLRRAARVAPDLRSVGIDTWGVDVGLLDAAGSLVGNPVHHRDPRNLPAVERVHARIPQADLYARTGLQFLPFNTLYQLEAARVDAGVRDRAARPAAARPARVLADRRRRRRAHARVHDRPARSADRGVGRRSCVARLGLDPGAAAAARGSRAPCGDRVLPSVRAATGLPDGCVVTLVGSHDTASAVVGVPAASDGRRLHLVGDVVARRRRDAPRRSSPRRAGRRTSPTRAAWTGRSGSCAT